MTSPQLRPLRVADILDAAFQLYRRQFARLLSISAVVLAVPTALELLVGLTGLNSLIEFVQNLLLLPVLTAALIVAASGVYWNEPPSMGGALRRGFARYLSVLGASMLIGLIIAAPLLLGGVIALVAGGIGASGWVLGVLLGLLIIPLAVVIGVRYAVALPAVVLERLSASKALGRSRALTKGVFWHTAWTTLCASLLTVLIGQLPTVMLSMVTVWIASSSNAAALLAAQTLLSQAGLMLTLPLQYLIVTVLYYDLRVRTEGYDIEQAARQQEALAAPLAS